MLKKFLHREAVFFFSAKNEALLPTRYLCVITAEGSATGAHDTRGAHGLNFT